MEGCRNTAIVAIYLFPQNYGENASKNKIVNL